MMMMMMMMMMVVVEMVDLPVVGFRFHPTAVELVEKYLRPKNDPDSDTTHVDRVLNTLNMSSFDPWELPSQSIMKSEDQAWYFFCRKEYKYQKGHQQSRNTKSGFWKKTGKAVIIKQNGVKIGEKWVLVFHLSKNLKTQWVMHEYHATPTPTQKTMTYTVCKVRFEGEISSPPSGEIEHNHFSITHMNNYGGVSTRSEEEKSFECPQSQELENPQHLSGVLDVIEISSPPRVEIEHNHYSFTHMNNSGGVSTRSEVGTLSECPQSQELENQSQLSGFPYLFEEILLVDTMRTAISNMSNDEWNNFLSDDDYEQREVVFMQEDRNDHIPKKPITGILIGYSSDDDSDSDLISSTTGSIQTSSTCEDSFGSSNHRVDQIINLQESPNSTIKLSQKVNQTPDQETEIGELKLGQEKIKNKRVGFFNSIIQKFIKKIQLCTCI